jgi:hypothetical protein
VKRIFSLIVALAAILMLASVACPETYVSKSDTGTTIANVSFAPDNTKQIVVRYLEADSDLAGAVITLKFSGTRTSTNIAGAPGLTGGTGQAALPVVSNVGITTGDRVYVYIISGASAGNGWDDIVFSSGIPTTTITLTSNLPYTCPHGTYVYPMTVVTGGTISCGTTGLSLSNASGIIATPKASPLVLELTGTANCSLYSIMAVYAN